MVNALPRSVRACMRFLWVLVIGVVLPFVSAATIASDTFECGGFTCGSGWTSNWFNSGDCIVTGLDAPRGSFHMRGQEDASGTCIANRNFTNLDYSSSNVSFWAKSAVLEAGDFCRYYYYNGSAHLLLLEMTAGNDDDVYRQYNYSVTGYGLSANAGIRMRQFGVGSDNCYLDDIVILGGATEDTAVPLLSVVSPLNTSYTSVQTALTYTVSDINLQACWYSLDLGVTNTTVACGTNVTGLTSNQGSNTWNVYANDSAGNTNSSAVTFSVDSLAPTVDFVTPTEANTSILARSFILINVTALDTNLANITLRWYNGSHTLINQTTTTTSPNEVNISSLSDGQYFFNATATDLFNNQNTTETRTVTIDATLPLISFTIGTPANATYSRGTSLFVNVSVTETNEGAIAFTLSNATAVVNRTMLTNNARTINWTNLADSVYYYTISVNDTAGNTNVTVTRTYTVDTMTPFVSFVYPLNLTYTQVQTALTYTVSDINLQACWYSLDLGVTNTTVACGTNVTGLTSNQGSNTWNVYVNDSAGNEVVDSRSFSVLLPTHVPTVVFNAPSNGSLLTTSSVVLNATVYDLDLDSLTVWFYGDELLLTSLAAANGSSLTYNWSSLGEGAHNWTVIVFDGSENSTRDYQFFTVDLTAFVPEVNITAPTLCFTSGTNMTLALNVSVNRSVSGSCWYTLDEGSTNVTLANCQNATFNVLGDGSYRVRVYANESVEGLVGSASVPFAVRVGAPTISIVQPANNSYLNHSLVQLQYYTDSPEGQSTSVCRLRGDFNGTFSVNQTNASILSGAVNSFFVNLTEGVYQWDIDCDNPVRSAALMCNYTFTSDVTPPNITIYEPNGTYSTTTPIPLSFNASDTLSPVTLCSYNLSFSLGGASVQIGVLGGCNNTFITIQTQGTYNLSLGALDAAGNSQQSSTSFAVQAASGGPGGGGSGGGGGGGFSGLGGPAYLTLRLPDSLTVRRGHLSQFSLSAVNSGARFLNGCQLHAEGPAATWVNGEGRYSLSSGEQATYDFSIDVPRDTAPGAYTLSFFVSCEDSALRFSVDTVVTVVEGTFDFLYVGSSRPSVDTLVIEYDLYELSGALHTVLIDYTLFNFDRVAVVSGSESVLLQSSEQKRGSFAIPLPKDSFGDFYLTLHASDGSDSVYINRTIPLTSSGLSGFAISDENRRTLSISAAIIFGLVLLFVAVRFIYRRYQLAHYHPPQRHLIKLAFHRR